jgi:2-desacetyl-2-hydroxyethyl bacteriochlorophyllide A dehydrogenase
MKAMVLEADDRLAARDVARPVAASGEALVRVTHSGICGTDLKIYQGGIVVSHPLIMGHEMVGEIVTGEGCDGAGPGARVIVDPMLFCGTCYHCRAGQNHICPTGTLMGRDRDGGFAEFVAAPSANVFPLPDDVGAAEAPLIQVLTTCFHGHRLTPIMPGEAVVVIGLGVTGQLHLQLAKARGAGPVIGISRTKWKRELAEEMGADATATPGEAAREAVMRATDGRGADLIIESVGQVPVIAEAIDLVRTGGRLMLFGIHTATSGELPFYQLYFKELEIINARAAKGEDYPASIDLVRRGAVRLGPLLSHRLALGEMQTALDMLGEDGLARMKIVLEH